MNAQSVEHFHELQKLNSLMFIEGQVSWKDAVKKGKEKLKNKK